MKLDLSTVRPGKPAYIRLAEKVQNPRGTVSIAGYSDWLWNRPSYPAGEVFRVEPTIGSTLCIRAAYGSLVHCWGSIFASDHKALFDAIVEHSEVLNPWPAGQILHHYMKSPGPVLAYLCDAGVLTGAMIEQACYGLDAMKGAAVEDSLRRNGL